MTIVVDRKVQIGRREVILTGILLLDSCWVVEFSLSIDEQDAIVLTTPPSESKISAELSIKRLPKKIVCTATLRHTLITI
mgnify:FL=1